MAEGFLSDFAVALTSKVGSLLLDEIVLLWGVNDELAQLKETVDTVGAVLLDAEEKSIHSPPVKQWLEKLSDAMYDAEDLLDEFSYEALHQQLKGGSGTSKKVRLFFSRSNQVAFGLKMAHKIKELRKRFNEIADLRHKFHLEARSAERRPFMFQVRDSSHSTPPPVVIGREADKEEIVEHLLSSGSEVQNVSFIAIHGIGGLGKTTLAQLVYNDDRVWNHFEVKIWVCVSDEFDVKLLLKKVMESATEEAPSCNEMEPLKNLLHKQIKGKRYLLVLDDVWNEDVNKWRSFEELLVCGSKGSKVVVTTRLEKVADMSQPVHKHHVKGLLEEDAWFLFAKMAFKQGEPPNQSFEDMGKEIVAKCCGVPLAIRTIGALLHGNNSLVQWRSFNDNELSKTDVFQTDILPILKLSYDHLPMYHKRCFAYCCLFPKDFRISVEKLILLWKAQGYVQPTNQSESPRDVGLKYFKDLLRLSFFQDVEEDHFGNIEYCKMHDLMHDLAVSVAGDNFYVSAPCQITRIKSNIQHMSLCHASSLLKMKKVRTIFKLIKDEPQVFGESEADAIFRNLRCLRVLDLSAMGISTLPKSIYEMKLLRYLDLSRNRDIKELPKSLVSLHNLQGLDLEECSDLRKWPSDVSQLVNLTDLNIDKCCRLKYMPPGIGKLTKLEKLCKFTIAEDQSTSKHSASLNELHSLDNLRGEFEIMNLSFVKNAASKLREGLLSSKHNLRKLKLDWGYNGPNNVVDLEMVMEALCPHPNLKALEVDRYKGLKPPSWLPLITNLVTVRIRNCSSIQRLPPFDQLLHLQKLWISQMSSLESIEVEYGGGSSSFFPSLTCLTFLDCPKLKGFERLSSLSKEELPYFPCLSELLIRWCPNMIQFPIYPGVGMWDCDGDVELSHGILRLIGHSGLKPPSWLPSFTNLVAFVIYSCRSIRRLPPFDQLLHLQGLNISEMPELESIEIAYGGRSSLFFPSLIFLTLYNCPKLKGFEGLSSLSNEELPCFPCLSELSIRGCPNLIHLSPSPGLEILDVSWGKSLFKILMMPTNSAITLSKLQELKISDMEDCTENELNDWMQGQSFEILRRVEFWNMENMVSLPMFQHATTLQHLRIYSCYNLECIPEWMTNLSALKYLAIENSPRVERRFLRLHSAEDWHKISHIPNIQIGEKQIQRGGHYLL